MKDTRWDDQRIEIIIGNLLRYGVVLSAAVVFVGAVIYLLHHGQEIPDYSSFRGEPQSLRRMGEVLTGAIRGNGRATIQLGILVLIATPVARVAFSAVAFALEHDYLYVLVTVIVLAILLFSLFGATKGL
jgi:uncharacterized membrane protein